MESSHSGGGENVVVVMISKDVRTRNGWETILKNGLRSPDIHFNTNGRVLDASPTDALEHGRAFKINATTLDTQEQIQTIIKPLPLQRAHHHPGLAVFDMDSTLIQQEVIDELARTVGCYSQVAAITEAAMRGELDFEQSLRARVALLKGVDADVWELLKRDVITITPGAETLIHTLRALGWKTAVLSGGFTPLANWLKEKLGLDYAFANHLALDESGTRLSGELVVGSRIVDGKAKRELLLQLAGENGIAVENVIAVGDGSNDLLMMHAAGWGIAFNAKPKVQEAAPARLNSGSLLDVMYLLGFTAEEIGKATATMEG